MKRKALAASSRAKEENRRRQQASMYFTIGMANIE